MKLLTKTEIRERLLQIDRGEAAGYADLVMSGLIALGGIVLIDILSGPSDNVLRAVLWLGSMTTIWTVHSFTRHASVWSPGRQNLWQLILTRLGSITHFMLFAFLANTFLTQKYWAYWSVAMALHCAFAMLAGIQAKPFRSDDKTLDAIVAKTQAIWSSYVLTYSIGAILVAGFTVIAPAELTHYAQLAAAGLSLACCVVDVFMLQQEQRLLDSIEAALQADVSAS